MYAIAERHLIRVPHLARTISSRFPFVLLDEVQDTDTLQQRLLDEVFGSGGTVAQRVGDVNQRIFSDRPKGDIGAAAFPSPRATELPVSRRFGCRTAELASELTVHRRQKITGAGLDATGALFLCDEQSVPDVVPAFERLAAETAPEDLLCTSPPRVLGARKRPGEAQRFPRSVACYVPEFDAGEKTSGTHGSLADLVWAARTRWAPGTSREAATDLGDGIRGPQTTPCFARASIVPLSPRTWRLITVRPYGLMFRRPLPSLNGVQSARCPGVMTRAAGGSAHRYSGGACR